MRKAILAVVIFAFIAHLSLAQERICPRVELSAGYSYAGSDAAASNMPEEFAGTHEFAADQLNWRFSIRLVFK